MLRWRGTEFRVTMLFCLWLCVPVTPCGPAVPLVLPPEDSHWQRSAMSTATTTMRQPPTFSGHWYRHHGIPWYKQKQKQKHAPRAKQFARNAAVR